MAEIIGGRPYIEVDDIRVFPLDKDDDEFVWHRDRELREIEILEGQGWQFQFENCLPWLLEVGMIFYIPKGEMHRLIKGKTPLKCRIIKYGNSTATA